MEGSRAAVGGRGMALGREPLSVRESIRENAVSPSLSLSQRANVGWLQAGVL